MGVHLIFIFFITFNQFTVIINQKQPFVKKDTSITNLYLDTEFTSLQQNAFLLSIALVADNEESFYAEFTDYPMADISPWIKENVLDNFILEDDLETILEGTHWRLKADRKKIHIALEKFIKQFETIIIWADHVAYDWVFFCELFGGALQLPKNIHYMPMDLPTALYLNGVSPDISREKFVGKHVIEKFPSFTKQRHNALYDAYLLKSCVKKILKN